MLKHKNTYEIISPADIGLIRSNESGIVLGKLRYAGSTLLMQCCFHGVFVFLFFPPFLSCKFPNVCDA